MKSGTCGKNLTWTLDDNGTLTISGQGAMENYHVKIIDRGWGISGTAPWSDFGESINAVIIEDGVTYIGERAFESYNGYKEFVSGDCNNLEIATIPASVKIIGAEAFSGCRNLTSVTIFDGVKSIGYGTFEDCSNLRNITIPASVKTIGVGAFSGCRNLTSVTIPDGVKSVGYGTFKVARDLKKFIILQGEALKKIYRRATTRNSFRTPV